MLSRLQLFRNIGQFDSVASAANIALAPLTLIFAENGRGKTTLASILRSLATGDPIPIAERRRLASQNPPHVVIDCTGGPPPAVFENNAWNRTLPNLTVFDDTFVDQNVYSGLAVGSEHRQNLHELILGSQGVVLNNALQAAVAAVEEHNRVLRTKADAIPANMRGGLSVDEFCALSPRADIDAAIAEAERSLAAAREQDAVRRTAPFDAITLPEIDVEALTRLLARDLADVDAAAMARVQSHLQNIGEGGEAWVESGMQRVYAEGGTDSCPFCAQPLATSPIISHYRAYFSDAYTALKQDIANATMAFTATHGGDARISFERAIRVSVERRQFWSRFAEVPEIVVDTAAISQTWGNAYNAIVAVLAAKRNAPLERIGLPNDARPSFDQYARYRDQVSGLNQALQRANAAIAIVKERAALSNAATLQADLVRLNAIKSRHSPAIAALCDAYVAEKAAKVLAEQARDTARDALNQYRQAAFPAYQDAINIYLQRFNAGFRLGNVVSTNVRGGSSCTYNVVINNQAIPIANANAAPGTPSFRNSLSAGDRNTLALAFFFASLDRDPNRADKVVVIDDPKSSLDEHRSLTTVQEVRRLADQVSQVIVLSHEKSFLCDVWQGMDANRRVALEVVRDNPGSTIRAWDVNRDCITEHDRRHEMLRAYAASSAGNAREVAQSLRPTLESFLRVASPEFFLPGTLLGPFRNLCQQRVNTQAEILNAADTTELDLLTEYANRFHHDTNPAWQTANINDGELLGFVQRTIAFAKR